MNKEYKSKIKCELARYDMSLKAYLLNYDSWYIGNYLKAMRITQWTKAHPNIYNQFRGGGNVCDYEMDKSSNWFPILWL